MFILYDIIFILVFLFWYLPEYLFKGKFHSGFLMRLGIFPRQIRQRLAGKQTIWLHAVSVGEVLAARELLEGLRKEYPQRQIVISTVTPTGNAVARKIAAPQDLVIYLPLDISFIAAAVVRRINPLLVIIAETELWPNLIGVLNRRKVPIITVNARISDGSFRGYGLIRFLIRPVLNKISLFCLQGETDAQRLAALGASPEKLRVTGNMKFDNADYSALRDPATRDAEHRKRLGLGEKERLLTAGSTHPGEEEMILRVYKGLLKDFPGLKLLIAPRHPERSKEIGRLALNYGFDPIFISKLQPSAIGHRPPGHGLASYKPEGDGAASDSRSHSQSHRLSTVFILDTIGQLTSFYAVSDIVFVGKSLVNKGGQNILEPAFFAKPILFGPHMFNFREITALFLANQAAVMVKDEEDLSQKIQFLLANPDEVDRLGRAGKELLNRNQGATKRNLEAIKTYQYNC